MPRDRRPDAVTVGGGAGGGRLRALVVDDEVPALEELSWLLRQDERIGEIRTASSGADALRALEEGPVDVVFSDISMPGLDGMDLARVFARFAHRPQIVSSRPTTSTPSTPSRWRRRLRMKPVRADRLAEAVRRVVEPARASPAAPPTTRPSRWSLAASPGSSPRSQVRYVEAQGDYARLHTAGGSHLVRMPLTTLEERWGAAGFVRIHRSTLVALRARPRGAHGRRPLHACASAATSSQVSRRHTRELRDRLMRRPGRATP